MIKNLSNIGFLRVSHVPKARTYISPTPVTTVLLSLLFVNQMLAQNHAHRRLAKVGWGMERAEDRDLENREEVMPDEQQRMARRARRFKRG
jgi:hypothetical protein